MSEDYLLAISAAVLVASVVILASFLVRYRSLVQESAESTTLAKNVWDSMNSRFSVVDTRIIDLMAKTEVLSAKLGMGSVAPRARQVQASPTQAEASRPAEIARRVVVPLAVITGEGTETESRVLQLLAGGPKTSAEIKEQVGRSREHTARLMKALFDRGLVVRNDRHKPYVYEITDQGRTYVAS